MNTVSDLTSSKRKRFSANNKAYCTCRAPKHIYMELYKAPKGKFGHAIWVHAECGKPSRLLWRAYIVLCSECLEPFSNPWSDICKLCHKEDLTKKKERYKGWSYWRFKSSEELKNLLTESATSVTLRTPSAISAEKTPT